MTKDFVIFKRVPGAKRPVRESDYSPQPNAVVMTVCDYSNTSIPTRLHWIQGHNFTLHMLIKSWTFMVLWRSCKNLTFDFLKRNLSITVFQCYTGYSFSVAFRQICRFTASSGIWFLCFVTLSISFFHFISGLPLLFLPFGDQVSIRSDLLLSPMRNACPYHFNVLKKPVLLTVD